MSSIHGLEGGHNLFTTYSGTNECAGRSHWIDPLALQIILEFRSCDISRPNEVMNGRTHNIG